MLLGPIRQGMRSIFVLRSLLAFWAGAKLLILRTSSFLLVLELLRTQQKNKVGPRSLNFQEIAETRVATIKSGESLIKSYFCLKFCFDCMN
jgi:hypothetical protein